MAKMKLLILALCIAVPFFLLGPQGFSHQWEPGSESTYVEMAKDLILQLRLKGEKTKTTKLNQRRMGKMNRKSKRMLLEWKYL